jgi:hypothetical protein
MLGRASKQSSGRVLLSAGGPKAALEDLNISLFGRERVRVTLDANMFVFN